MSCCRSLIPSLVKTHRMTNAPMIVLDALAWEAGRTVHGDVHEHDGRNEGKHPGCRRRSRQAFVAGDVLVMLAEREPDLPLHHRIHQ